MRASLRLRIAVAVWILLFAMGVVEASAHGLDQQSAASQTSAQLSPEKSPASIPDQPAIEALATKMAGAIDKAKYRTILVFDFVGPRTEPEFPVTDFPSPKQQKKADKKRNAKNQWPTVSALGQRLAANFTTAIAQSLPGVKVQSWGDLQRALPADDYAPDLARDVTTAWWISQTHRFDAFVWPDLEQTPNGPIKLQVVCYRVTDGQSLVGFNTNVSLTPAAQQMSETAVHYAWHSDTPTGAQKGYTYPRCEHCPQADYSSEGIAHRVAGTVVMVVIVTGEGRAKEIKILRALPFGLTEEAIRAVQGWRFKPALDEHGNPVTVRQVIEVTFHI